jgi:hypothetical protein
MILKVDIDTKSLQLHDTFVADSYEVLVKLVKEVASPIIVKTQPWYLKAAVKGKLKSMSPLEFGREVMKRYAKEMKEVYVEPPSCVEVVDWAIAHNLAKMEGK